MSEDRAASPGEMVRAALDYRKRGCSPICIQVGEKGPKTKGWQNLRHNEHDIPTVFGRVCNIGLMLGEPSGWLIDADFDCQEAVALAPLFLPATGWMSGRKSKRKSHWWYIAEVRKTTTYKYEGGMLVELRSTRLQTVVPPSLHPSGERYEWDEYDQPARVDAVELSRAVAYLAAAALLARNWPRGEGSRQSVALAISGYLLRGGLPQEVVEKIVQAAAHADEEQDKRIGAVANSAAKVKNNEPATGGPTLAELMNGKVVELLKKWLGLNSLGVAGQAAPTQATLLIDMTKDLEVFHDPLKDAYVTFPVKDHFETWAVSSKHFRLHLQGAFYRKLGKVPSAQALQDCQDFLEVKAREDGPEHRLFIRVGEDSEALYLDLCDDDWQAVRITSEKVEMVQRCPIKFRRAQGMLALPVPIMGGSVNELRRFLNAEDESNWILMLMWLLATYRPTGPYPALAINGEQGSAKTTAERILRRLIDPNKAELRTQPKDLRDLAIAANNSQVVAFDNLSSIPPWFSDALCRLATGGAFATRLLYSDDGEALFEFQKPCMFNGIPELVTRSDLIDRAIILTLPPIDPEKRRAEKDFWWEFDEAKPQILGALLAVVSQALERLPHVALKCKPRMADFAIWATACEESLGMARGSFLKAYEGNREEGNAGVIESSPVAKAIINLLNDREEWSGTATDLLRLFAVNGDNRIECPKTPKDLSGAIREVAPNLRTSAKIGVEFKKQDHKRVIILKRTK